MSINGNKVTFWTSTASQSALLDQAVANGSFVYSTTDKALYLIEGVQNEIGRAIHPISTIIRVDSLDKIASDTANEALYLYNNYLYFHDGTNIKKLLKAEDLDSLNNSKLNKRNDISTNLTESSKFTVGTINSDRIEITNSTINKYSESNTNGTSVLFKGDVSVSNSGNTYTINDGNGNTITIDIPTDLVVKSGVVEEHANDFTYDGNTYKAGTYIVLKLNNSDETLIYINATALVDEYTANTSSETPVQIEINNRVISATLKNNSITSAYLADDITLTSLTVPEIKGSNNEPPADISFNGFTISANGDYSGNAKTATNLTNGKSISITGDMAGTINNVGTSDSSGTLTLNVVNTIAEAGEGNKITISPTVTSSTKDDVKINIPATTVNGKGLVTKVENISTSIGATNLVKQVQNEDNTTYPLLFTSSSTNGVDSSVAFNDNIKINPKTKTITADAFTGNAASATKLETPIKIELTNAVAGKISSWANGDITLTTVGPGRVDKGSNAPLSETTKGQDAGISSANTSASFKIPNITMNTDGMVSNISDVSVQLTLNNVSQTADTSSNNLPILIADSENGGTAGTKYVKGVIINPSTKTITASTFNGSLDGNANTASAFKDSQAIRLTGAVTGEVSSVAGWNIGVTSNSKLISGSSSSDVANTTSDTPNPYLNLYAPNATGEDTVSSTLQLKGDGATTVNAANGIITIASTDYSSAIAAAQTSATNAAKTIYNTYATAGTTDTQYPILGGTKAESGYTQAVSYSGATISEAGYIHGNKVYGSVWNDYAEYRQTHHKVRPGQCVYEKGDGSLAISYERMMPGANIVSDTFGFAIGETDDCKTPLAVSGRVLAYPYEPKEEYKAGDAVCSGPNGTISKMTRAEIRDYPERIIGTVSEIPSYEVWGSGNVKVDGRIWIKVR